MIQKREMVWILLGLFLVLTSAILHVTFYDRLIKKRYNLSALRVRLQETRQELLQLQTVYEGLITPQRLAELSRYRLHLVPPRQLEIMTLRRAPDEVLRLAQNPPVKDTWP